MLFLPQKQTKQGLNFMYKSTTISGQLLGLADRLGFGEICREEKADYRYRSFTARTQLYAMMVAQLTNQKGLRSIENTIASDNDLYHTGIRANVTRTNFAHANENRPSGVFQKILLSSSFVTMNKKNIEYEVLSSDSEEKSDANFTIIRDEKILMGTGQKDEHHASVTLRQIVSRDRNTGKEIQILTNMFDADPLEVAAIYKKRWTVELFFKMIKQNLRVKRFYGQSETAVKTQIWIALIVHLLFLILKAMNGNAKRTFSSFCSEISVVLFRHRNLDKWFSGDYEKLPPPAPSDNNS